MYEALSKAGHITRRSVRQAYDEKAGMFLPDRYVKGTCPICRTPDQYGDSCENCSGTYTPLDLIDPVSVVTGTRPVERESEHLFFRLGDFESMLRKWTRSGALQESVANKLDEWFEAGLRDWDVSRDAPYFGFEIPDAPGKYFYVWLALRSLHASLDLCARSDFRSTIMKADSTASSTIHRTDSFPFIRCSGGHLEGAGSQAKPGAAHGFLTVNARRCRSPRTSHGGALHRRAASDIPYFLRPSADRTLVDVDQLMNSDSHQCRARRQTGHIASRARAHPSGHAAGLPIRCRIRRSTANSSMQAWASARPGNRSSSRPPSGRSWPWPIGPTSIATATSPGSRRKILHARRRCSRFAPRVSTCSAC